MLRQAVQRGARAWRVVACSSSSAPMDELRFEKLAEETLHALADAADGVPERVAVCPRDFDVSLGGDVLTVTLGGGRGTFVVNKQTPNRQMWLSSPLSGPKRFDYIDERWTERRTGLRLHDLLTDEFRRIFGVDAIQL